MAGPTTYGDIGQRTAAWAAVEMLAHAEPILVLSRFGMAKPIPKNKAKVVKFRRPIPFTVSTVPAVEGVTPVAQKMEYEDVPATLDQYIGVTGLTDWVEDTVEDPVLKDIAALSGEQAAETQEMVLYGVLKAGTNVFYGASADTARTDVNDPVTIDRLRKLTRFLKGQRAKHITKMIGSSPNFSTEPVASAFIAFAHTDVEADIMDLPNFTPIEKYGSMKAFPHEIGKVGDIRFILSPLLSPFLDAGSATLNGMLSSGTKVDVYPIIVVAQDAYGLVTLKGKDAITPMVLNPNKPRGGDPAGQRGTVSWKTYFTAVILNQAWMARLEVGVTEL